VDTRTDIFSLGIVIYEMISGHPPFNGATSSDVLVAILEKNPQPLASTVSDEMRWCVTKALAKDVDERYQTAKDFLTDLKRIRKRLDIDEELRRSDPTAVSAPARKKAALRSAVVIGFITLAIILFVFFRPKNKKAATHNLPFAKIKLTRLTSSGTARGGIISPDGKYVTYVQKNSQGQESLFLKQLSADTEIPILTLPQKTFFYGGRRFAPDGESIYYLSASEDKDFGSLYQIPVLGGTPYKLIDNVSFIPAISPDGKRIAFVRFEKKEYSVILAQSDGTQQRKIKTHKLTENYNDLKWSPDGKIITSILTTTSKDSFNNQIMGIYLSDGIEKPLYDIKWSSELGSELEWLEDGSGMILTKEREGSNQIYYLPFPKGKLIPITDDFNNYQTLSLSRDSKYIVTTQREFNSAIWAGSSAKPEAASSITSGSPVGDGSMGLSWTHDNKILFNSVEAANGSNQISIINKDGQDRKKITAFKENKYWAVASPDGHYIAYNSESTGIFGIWRMDSDGSNPKLLSGKNQARWPRFSPDSSWILFSTFGGEKQSLLKIMMKDDKEITLASHKFIYGAAISPDGSKVAYVFMNPDNTTELMLNIISAEGGHPLKTFKMETGVFPGGRIHWTPDGSGIAYIRFQDDVANIHVQPIDGSPVKALTKFNSDMITNFAWSLDGKQIAYSRGKDNYDVVLIQSVP
jgi:Tol biopolymer transport system component